MPYWDCKRSVVFSDGGACIYSVQRDESRPENGGRNRRWEIEMDDRTVRAALERHWGASDANDFDAEHEIYREDAVFDYPQSRERIGKRRHIQERRYVQPSETLFTVRQIIGSGDLWVTEFVLCHDDIPPMQ